MEFREQAIVLRLGSFKEADLWVRLLSPKRGVFSAFAFGGSKSRRRFSGCLDLFNEVVFQIKKQDEYFSLQEGLLVRGPDLLRRDWRRLGVAVNCALFLESFCKNSDKAAEVHSLFVGLLNTLESGLPYSTLLPIFFRIRLASEQGYALDPDTCSLCGASLCEAESDQAVLPLSENGLICRRCAGKSQSGPRFALSRGSLAVLKHILKAPPAELRRPPGGEDSQKECVRALEAFLQRHTGLSWERGGFRRA